MVAPSRPQSGVPEGQQVAPSQSPPTARKETAEARAPPPRPSEMFEVPPAAPPQCPRTVSPQNNEDGLPATPPQAPDEGLPTTPPPAPDEPRGRRWDPNAATDSEASDIDSDGGLIYRLHPTHARLARRIEERRSERVEFEMREESDHEATREIVGSRGSNAVRDAQRSNATRRTNVRRPRRIEERRAERVEFEMREESDHEATREIVGSRGSNAVRDAQRSNATRRTNVRRPRRIEERRAERVEFEMREESDHEANRQVVGSRGSNAMRDAQRPSETEDQRNNPWNNFQIVQRAKRTRGAHPTVIAKLWEALSERERERYRTRPAKKPKRDYGRRGKTGWNVYQMERRDAVIKMLPGIAPPERDIRGELRRRWRALDGLAQEVFKRKALIFFP